MLDKAMKNIGIMTLYFDNDNYGALLQAFALQKVVQDIGYKAQLISYDLFAGYNEDYSYKKNKIKSFVKRFIPGFWQEHSRYSLSLKKFERTIPHTRYVDYKSVGVLNSEYDGFLCGSDQIWNPIGWRPDFFLRFSTKAKISYAASIARDTLTEKEIAYIDEMTNDFTALSVREKNSADNLSQELNREIKLMPDPSLLVTQEEWNDIFSNSYVYRKPYLFAYFLGFDAKQRDECIAFAKRNDLDIFFIPYMKKESYLWDCDNVSYCVKDYGVERFVDLIRNAEIVLTDSYHGTVFSCLFNKPFYVFDRKLTNDTCSMSSRIDTLFYELHIPNDRKINSVDSIADCYGWNDGEIKCIEESIAVWRKKGLEYLIENISKI